MEFRKASSDALHENAYINNTFSLPETERSLRTTMENSYNYLQRIQKSYVDINRFTYTTDDLYVDSKGKVCLTINKGFVEAINRYAYRTSDVYGKWLSLSELNSYPHLFSYIPIITIDNKSVFSYDIKCELDVKTHIRFNHVDNYQTFIGDKEVEDIPTKIDHNIEVTILRTTAFDSVIASDVLLEDGTIEYSNFTKITGPDLPVLVYFQSDYDKYGTQAYFPEMTEDGIKLDMENNPSLQRLFDTDDKVTMYVYRPSNGYRFPYTKSIHTRVDNGRKSVILIAEPENLKTFHMAIPVNNIILIVTDIDTGIEHLETARDITLHYPNIYEVDCTGLDLRKNKIKAFFLYEKLDSEVLKYSNRYEYIHKYYSTKLELPLVDAIDKLLYTRDVDSNLQQFFLSTFDYEDPEYVYNLGDFSSTSKPYDFDYKINKMKDFVSKDATVLKEYGKRVAVLTESYVLDVRTIDLEKRLRNNTYGETTDPGDRMEFEEPTYVFAFRNETNDKLNLRIFVDGLLRSTLTHIETPYMDYIYIPCSMVESDSFIEIEKFHKYKYKQEAVFENDDTEVFLNFPKSPVSTPTYYDLYVTDESGERLDRSKFRIFAVIDPREYNISDTVNEVAYSETFSVDRAKVTENTPDMPDYDPNVDIFIELTDGIYDENDDGVPDTDDGISAFSLGGDVTENLEEINEGIDGSLTLGSSVAYAPDPSMRLPVAYFKIKKLKISTDHVEYQNIKTYWNINKVPYLCTSVMKSNGSPIGRLPSLGFKWREDESYVRFFHNGRFIPIEFTYVDTDPTKPNYFITKRYAKRGDVIDYDITPYSYTREFAIDEIPENFVINISDVLSKPFSSAYYDVYLNGRKLSDKNIQMIGSYQLRLVNVSSRKNFYVYRKDRDYEYYSMSGNIPLPIDAFLDSELISDEDKEAVISRIITDAVGGFKPPVDTEEDTEFVDESVTGSMAMLGLYYDVILPLGKIQPNTTTADKIQVEYLYEDAVNTYREGDRIVIRPNINAEAPHALVVGRDSSVDI